MPGIIYMQYELYDIWNEVYDLKYMIWEYDKNRIYTIQNDEKMKYVYGENVMNRMRIWWENDEKVEK